MPWGNGAEEGGGGEIEVLVSQIHRQKSLFVYMYVYGIWYIVYIYINFDLNRNFCKCAVNIQFNKIPCKYVQPRIGSFHLLLILFLCFTHLVLHTLELP